jgi:hypothetical protein
MFVATTNQPRIYFEYTPRPKVLGTKIVFIQIAQSWLDGRIVKPSALNAGIDFKDADMTGQGWHVDYVQGEKDPYYNGDDDPDVLDIGPTFGGRQGDALAKPPVSAKMNDRPNYDDSWFPTGTSKTQYQFVTAVFSAAGADAGTYYQYQAWTFEKEKGKKAKIALGLSGRDPGLDFRDAVALWVGNHPSPSFTLPPLPPPGPPRPGHMTYVVKAGDTLPKIAQALYGRDYLWPAIYGPNKSVIGANHDPSAPLYPGLLLVLPP